MNEALGSQEIPTNSDEAAIIWNEYSRRWTSWNHLRTVSSLFALLLVGGGLLSAGRFQRLDWMQ
jgi:uncharacterized membrane protein